MRHTLIFLAITFAAGLFLTAFARSDGCAPPAKPSTSKRPGRVAGRGNPILDGLVTSSTRSEQGAPATAIADIAERCRSSVVSIESSRLALHVDDQTGAEGLLEQLLRPGSHRFKVEPYQRMEHRYGSGVIVSDSGILLTNNHLVHGASKVQVTLSDGRQVEASVVGTDPMSDLAVLRLPGGTTGLRGLPFGRSEKLRVGEVILSVGHPFGVGQAVTMGIVSAKGMTDLGFLDFEDFIQTDAALNPGSSGGALVNLDGELVGINTAILSGVDGHSGIGFAIPVDMARPIMESLLKHGHVRRGWLGVGLQDMTPELAQALGADARHGVVVSEVFADTPAQLVGIQRGDVVQAINGHPVRSIGQMKNRVSAMSPGTRIEVRLIRKNRSLSLLAVLTDLPKHEPAPAAAPSGSEVPEPALAGLVTKEIFVPRHERHKAGLASGSARAVIVKQVAPSSAADEAGIEPGDRILEVNRQPISSVREIEQVFATGQGPVLLLVDRRARTTYHVVASRKTSKPPSKNRK